MQKKLFALVLGIFALKVAMLVPLQASHQQLLASAYNDGDLFSSVVSADHGISSEMIVSLTNNERAAKNMKSLKVSDVLRAAAQAKADDMLARQYFAHNTPDGQEPWSFLKAQKYYFLYAGENLAMSYNTSEGVIQGWMASTEHRDNLLNRRYTEVGIGVAHGVYQGQKTIMVVQLLARPFVTPQALLSRRFPEKYARATMTDSVNSSEDLRQLYGEDGDTPNTSSFVDMLKHLYFYIALFLLADIVFRFIYLRNYKDRKVSLYTVGVFLLVLSTITFF